MISEKTKSDKIKLQLIEMLEKLGIRFDPALVAPLRLSQVMRELHEMAKNL